MTYKETFIQRRLIDAHINFYLNNHLCSIIIHHCDVVITTGLWYTPLCCGIHHCGVQWYTVVKRESSELHYDIIVGVTLRYADKA